jgi:alkyl hydroperoxide reductase subunit AhpC
MLGVGQPFPSFTLTATVSREKNNSFRTLTDNDYAGKWKVYFFWPKDFTFVCPTEIAAFGKLDKQFKDRDTQISGRQHGFGVRTLGLAQQPRRSS